MLSLFFDVCGTVPQCCSQHRWDSPGVGPGVGYSHSIVAGGFDEMS